MAESCGRPRYGMNKLSAPLAVISAMVYDILQRPSNREWSVQGFGMLRTYFGAADRFRLNVWTRVLAVPDVSIIHDHPWDFQSWVLAGAFRNVRYHPSVGSSNFLMQKIKTGPGGGPLTSPQECCLRAEAVETYYPGDTYHQRAEEVHASFYDDGSVTLNDRRRRGARDDAYVFWPLGTEWVDAQPRPATDEEVWETTRVALRKLEETTFYREV